MKHVTILQLSGNNTSNKICCSHIVIPYINQVNSCSYYLLIFCTLFNWKKLPITFSNTASLQEGTESKSSRAVTIDLWRSSSSCCSRGSSEWMNERACFTFHKDGRMEGVPFKSWLRGKTVEFVLLWWSCIPKWSRPEKLSMDGRRRTNKKLFSMMASRMAVIFEGFFIILQRKSVQIDEIISPIKWIRFVHEIRNYSFQTDTRSYPERPPYGVAVVDRIASFVLKKMKKSSWPATCKLKSEVKKNKGSCYWSDTSAKIDCADQGLDPISLLFRQLFIFREEKNIQSDLSLVQRMVLRLPIDWWWIGRCW